MNFEMMLNRNFPCGFRRIFLHADKQSLKVYNSRIQYKSQDKKKPI